VAINEGVPDNIAIEDIADAERSIRRAVTEDQADLSRKIAKGDKLDRKDIDAIRRTAQNVLGAAS